MTRIDHRRHAPSLPGVKSMLVCFTINDEFKKVRNRSVLALAINNIYHYFDHRHNNTNNNTSNNNNIHQFAITVGRRRTYYLALDTRRDGDAPFIQCNNILKNSIDKGQLPIVKYILNQDVIAFASSYFVVLILLLC